MIADGVLEMPASKISNTAGADSGFVVSACRIAQKSGDVMISFRSGQGFSVQSLRPRSTRPDALAKTSLGKLDTVWRRMGTRM